jgi:tetratricopeptide (TPR) repeat protein
MGLAVAAAVTLMSLRPARASDVDEARRHYANGTKAYEIGAYDEAIREYGEAYRVIDDPALLFNLGQAHRLAGHPVEAIRQYRMYLIKVHNASNRADVEQRIHDLEQQIALPPKSQPAPPLSPPAQTQAGPTTLTATPSTPGRPLYRRWWLWTAVGGAVAVGLGVGLALGLTPHDAAIPPTTNGNVPVTLH